MGVHASWYDDEHKLLQVAFVEPWNWDDYKAAVLEMEDMIASVQHKVNVMMDFSRSGAMPNGALHQFRDKAKNPHPNRGALVVVGANRMIQMLGNLLEHMFPRTVKEIKFFSTFDEAITYLHELQSRS